MYIERTRYRAINKALLEEYGDDAWDYMAYNIISKKCPICGCSIFRCNYSDERSVVETHEKCTVGCYSDSWAYGYTDLNTKGFSAHFPDHNFLKEDKAIIAKEQRILFEKAIRKNKVLRKQFRKLFYRKKNSQKKKSA